MISSMRFARYLAIAMLFLAIQVSAVDSTKPQIDLNGKYKAISWNYSHIGEQIASQKDVALTLSYKKDRLYVNSYQYEVDDQPHTLLGTKSDKYKAFWTDGGYKLVIETYVAEDGTYKLDKDSKPVKSVSSFSFTKDNKYLIWETVYPQGMTLTRKYERTH